MSEFRAEKYISDGGEIEVKVDYDNKDVWLTKRQLCLLYNSSISIINKSLKKVTEDTSVCAKSALTGSKSEQVQIEGDREVKRLINTYNLNIILQVGYKCNPSKAVEFKEWIDSLFKNETIDNNWLNRANNYEIVKFESDGISIDVNVSPNEDTVWLSREQISTLFDRDVKTISKHIYNALEEECKGATVANFETVQKEGDRLIKRNIEYFNLDVILSVGYRVKSQRGIEFRKWVNEVLKKHLLKGYSINTKRCLQHSDILMNLTNDINDLNNKYNKLLDDNKNINSKLDVVMDNFIDPKMYKHYLIKNGERIESDIAYQEIYSNVNKSLIIIDDYIDLKTLQLLKVINNKVDITIITENKGKNGLTKEYINDFINDTGYSIIIRKNNNTFHDRYIVIDYGDDNWMLYHCGSSSKDGGKRIGTIMLVEDKNLYKSSIDIALGNNLKNLF